MATNEPSQFYVGDPLPEHAPCEPVVYPQSTWYWPLKATMGFSCNGDHKFILIDRGLFSQGHHIAVVMCERCGKLMKVQYKLDELELIDELATAPDHHIYTMGDPNGNNHIAWGHITTVQELPKETDPNDI